MLVEQHPQLDLQRRSLGREGAPLLVIDRFVADPDKLVRKAARSHFAPQGTMFPGIRARAPLAYEVLLERLLRPLLPDLGLRPGRFSFPLCHYSLVVQRPETLSFLQRIPHIDSTTAQGLATVHYLFRGQWGGTAFYRHRATGFETVDESRRIAYFERLQAESEGELAPAAGYIAGDTGLFERIEAVEGVFNRLVVYRRNSLHSGDIDNARIPPPDPVAGRLSINGFIDVMP